MQGKATTTEITPKLKHAFASMAEELATDDGRVSVAAIARRLGLDRQTMFRVRDQLVAEGRWPYREFRGNPRTPKS